MSYVQLNSFTNAELADLIEVLEAEKHRAILPVAAYMELAITAGTSILYRRLKAVGDDAGAFAVVERYARQD